MTEPGTSFLSTHDSFYKNTSTPLYSQFIHLSRYSRWIEAEERRETWDETVDRYLSFFDEVLLSSSTSSSEYEETRRFLRDYIINLKSMPSMRALMTAGKALTKDSVAGYNCSYLPIDHVRSFDELMYILMCGTGVGFSVERQYVSKLPDVADTFYEVDTVISVADSKIGWASSLRQLISLLYSGTIPRWDLSKIRPAGARLKTFGGRASGPAPLESLFKFCVALFKRAAGRKLSSLECHDLVCKIADIVVVGGVRRSALISLSNLSDDRMRLAKSGQWWVEYPHRQLANNSASYTERPDYQVFLNEWLSLYESKSGERGIFSRAASKNQVAKNGRRDSDYDFGTNPCSEIILRPYQFCNLSEVVVRPSDTLADLLLKVEAATILGTLQSTVTNFRYLRPIWKKNTEEERLLGVSLTGIMDHPILGDPDSSDLSSWLTQMRQKAIDVNKEWSGKLKISQSTAITCVKPSGTVSQLVDSASGIHPRFSKFYVRRVRCDKKDPLASMMQMWGFPCEEDLMNPNVWVFSFPICAPETSVTTSAVAALSQLKLWKIYQDYWCEHKPSITVYYKDSEFLEVGSWVWNNLDSISGISFLPHSDHVYRQAPYEEIDEDTYLKLSADLPTDVDWSSLRNYETYDMTAGSQTLACAGGVCEVVDLVDQKT